MRPRTGTCSTSSSNSTGRSHRSPTFHLYIYSLVSALSEVSVCQSTGLWHCRLPYCHTRTHPERLIHCGIACWFSDRLASLSDWLLLLLFTLLTCNTFNSLIRAALAASCFGVLSVDQQDETTTTSVKATETATTMQGSLRPSQWLFVWC